MAMKCPYCGSENPEGKRFCGDCGATFSQPPPAARSRRTAAVSRKMSRMIQLAAAALVVAIIVVLAALIASMFLTHPPSPKSVLGEWVDRLNSGDARGAADLTIYSKMDRTSYVAHINYLATIVANLGTDNLVLNFAQDIPRDELIMEDWYSDLWDLTASLNTQYNIPIDDTMGVYCSITFYDDGVATVVTDSWPAFKVDSAWYLAYGL